MNDLNDMMVFATVVEKGSFTAAAETLHTPKSNISRKVTRLEQYLGVRLLERSTRSQSLTEVGQRYYRYCQRIKEDILAAETAVESLIEKPQGQLKLCSSVSIGQSLLSKHLGEFCQQYPDISLDIALTNRRVDLIEEGYDVVVRVGKLPDSGLVAKRLCSLTLRLYASPVYLQDAIRTPDDLLDHSLLLMSTKERQKDWILESGNEVQRIQFNPALRCDDFLLLKRLCAQGLGVTSLPDYMAEGLAKSGELVPVLESWHFAPVDLYAIYPSHQGATPKLRAFVDYLSKALQHDSSGK